MGHDVPQEAPKTSHRYVRHNQPRVFSQLSEEQGQDSQWRLKDEVKKSQARE